MFALAIPSAQSTCPSLHSVSLSILHFSGGFKPITPRQLLQSDTGVPHFGLDPLTYRCLLSLSPTADFAEPRPPRHIPPPPDSGREAWGITRNKPSVISRQPQELPHILFGLGSREGRNGCRLINLGTHLPMTQVEAQIPDLHPPNRTLLWVGR